jgi:urease accessory protein
MAPNTFLVAQLTDGRFPSGAHAYSGGMEQAITWGDVTDLATAESFAEGRASTVLAMAVQSTAAANLIEACHLSSRLDVLATSRLLDQLDGELDARMSSPAARAVSREQGRRWLRAAAGTWPEVFDQFDSRLATDSHWWVVTGAGCAALGMRPRHSATIILYDLVGTPLWAAVRLLGLDPVSASGSIARLVSRLGARSNEVCDDAAVRTSHALAASDRHLDLSWLACSTAPMSDLGSEAHLGREERLFAS